MPDIQGGRRVTVNAEELLRVVNQVADIASSGSNVVRLRWAMPDRPSAGSGHRLVLSARAEDVGDVEVVIMPAVVEVGDGEIAFNLRNLQQYLRGKTHLVTIATPAGDAQQVRGSMGVFTHRGGPTVIMMPMLVAADQPPAEEAEPAADGGGEEKEAGDHSAESATEEVQASPRRRERRRQDQGG